MVKLLIKSASCLAFFSTTEAFGASRASGAASSSTGLLAAPQQAGAAPASGWLSSEQTYTMRVRSLLRSHPEAWAEDLLKVSLYLSQVRWGSDGRTAHSMAKVGNFLRVSEVKDLETLIVFPLQSLAYQVWMLAGGVDPASISDQVWRLGNDPGRNQDSSELEQKRKLLALGLSTQEALAQELETLTESLVSLIANNYSKLLKGVDTFVVGDLMSISAELKSRDYNRGVAQQICGITYMSRTSETAPQVDLSENPVVGSLERLVGAASHVANKGLLDRYDKPLVRWAKDLLKISKFLSDVRWSRGGRLAHGVGELQDGTVDLFRWARGEDPLPLEITDLEVYAFNLQFLAYALWSLAGKSPMYARAKALKEDNPECFMSDEDIQRKVIELGNESSSNTRQRATTQLVNRIEFVQDNGINVKSKGVIASGIREVGEDVSKLVVEKYARILQGLDVVVGEDLETIASEVNEHGVDGYWRKLTQVPSS